MAVHDRAMGQAAGDAAWPAPKKGWEAEYVAKVGVLPDMASPPWHRAGYQYHSPEEPAYASLAPDDITGELCLILDHRSDKTESGQHFANWSLRDYLGQGDANDQITVEFRFRLLDDSEAKEQFSVGICRNTADGETISWVFMFGTNAIHTPGRGRVSAPLGTEWHTARLVIDAAANQASLYLDGAAEPTVLNAPGVNTGAQPRVQFGDGSLRVFGRAALSWIRFTNSELAIPQ